MHPPDPGAPPGHCTGGAVDVGIVYANGKELDAASAVRKGQNTWMTFYRELTPQARAHRALL